MAHAELGRGGSTAQRTLNCPGWAATTLALCGPPGTAPSSPYAEEGTRLHEVIAAAILRGKPPVDEPKAARAYFALEEGLHACGVTIKDVSIEQRVELAGVPGCFGTADVVFESKRGILHVIDFKFGDGVLVGAEGNDQLQYYACGVIDTLYEPGAFRDDEAVMLVIIQPAEGVDDVTSMWRTTVGALRVWKERFANALEQDDLRVGSWCRFCPAKAQCPEMRGEVKALIARPADALLPADLAEALAQAAELESWIDAARTYAQQVMEDGIDVPGWKLVAKRAQRKWAQPDSVIMETFRAQRLRIDVYAPRTLRSPAALEKELGKPLPDDLVVKESSGLTIAPASDKRLAITPTMEKLASNMRQIHERLGNR